MCGENIWINFLANMNNSEKKLIVTLHTVTFIHALCQETPPHLYAFIFSDF